MRIGTRASALALAQARWVAERLGPESELVPITTSGDVDRAAGDKSRWVSELELALLDGEVDLAVHSAKDLPTELADGLALAAIPARADPVDVICGASSLAALAPGARIGTSSLRRAAQLRAAREDVEIVAVRGNVDTRLGKLADGWCEALVLAAAGLERLGRRDAAVGRLTELVPAAGQGALALETRAGGAAAQVARALGDPQATLCVNAERTLVAALGASCNTPLGASARLVAPERVQLQGWVGLPDGSAWIADRLEGPPGEVGRAVAERMVAAGADELLRQAERMVAA